MKLWLISQEENNGYDTYDSAVVAAPDEKTARAIHPGSGELYGSTGWPPADAGYYRYYEWASSPESVRAEYLGEATEGREQCVILASFNAG